MIRIALLALVLAWPALAGDSFAGAWRGRWADPDFGQSGTVSIDVDADGHFSGPIGNDTLGLAGVVSGTIGPDGTATMTYSYDGGATANTATGQFTRTGDRLTGTVHFTGSDGSDLGAGTFELTSSASGTDL